MSLTMMNTGKFWSPKQPKTIKEFSSIFSGYMNRLAILR